VRPPGDHRRARQRRAAPGDPGAAGPRLAAGHDLDHRSRPRVRPKKRRRDRPIAPVTGRHEEARRRFVDGRPVSGLTTRFLARCTERLAARGTRVLVPIWDNASWHLSREGRGRLRAHHQRAHREGGGRMVPCWRPVKSPWSNPIAPPWVHAQRTGVAPARRPPAAALEERGCAAFGCAQLALLALPHEVA
jgi:hypothetical protein